MSEKLRGLIHFNERNNLSISIPNREKVFRNGKYFDVVSILNVTRNATVSGVTITSLGNNRFTQKGEAQSSSYIDLNRITADNTRILEDHDILVIKDKGWETHTPGTTVSENAEMDIIHPRTPFSPIFGSHITAGHLYDDMHYIYAYDLTAMFGDDIPTVEECKEIFKDVLAKFNNDIPAINIHLNDYIYNEEFSYSGELPVIGEV